MYDVFISYRRGLGSDHATAFESYLKSRGLTVYVDVNENFTGDFMKNIENAISKSHLFLLLITEGSLERMLNEDDISRKEIEYAMDMGIEVLPISTIQEKAFDDLNKLNLPEKIKSLSNLNIRLYKHEMRMDTLTYVYDTCLKVRKRNLDNVAYSFFSNNNKAIDKALSSYIVDVENHLTEFKGKRLKYTGRLKFTKMFGEGTLVDLSNGRVFNLVWNPYSNYSGDGEILLNGEVIYRGRVEELEPNGIGVLTGDDGTIYDGHFRDGKLSGHGLKIRPDGTTLTGEWMSGVLVANSHVKFPNGDEYYGNLVDEIPQGYGVMIRNDGSKYDGYFRNGVFDDGAIYIKNSLYFGPSEDWKPNGRVSVFNKDMRKLYEGSYKSGTPKGRGKLFVRGNAFNGTILPDIVYNKLKEFYPDFDAKLYCLSTIFDDSKIEDYSDFTLTDEETYEEILTGKVRKYSDGEVQFSISKNYIKVFEFKNY